MDECMKNRTAGLVNKKLHNAFVHFLSNTHVYFDRSYGRPTAQIRQTNIFQNRTVNTYIFTENIRVRHSYVA